MVTLKIIVIMVMGFINGSWFNNDTSTESVTLTIASDAPLRIDLGVDSEEIGMLSAGTRVEALFQTGLTYQVRAQDGTIGWVDYAAFEETKQLKIIPFKDREVGFFRELDENRWVGSDKIRALEAGEIVTFLEGFELKGFVKVRDSSGVVGYTGWHRARPAVEDIIPEYAQLNFVIVLQDDIEQNYLGGGLDRLIDYVGRPDAQIIDSNGNGFAFFRKLYLVRDGVRYGHIRFTIQDQRVASFTPQKEGESFFVESLPLAGWFRTLDFGVEFQKIQGFKLFPSTAEMGFFAKWGVRLLWLITLILFFSIPHFVASPLATGIGYIRALPNSLVRLLGSAVSLSLIYLFFLFISLHMMHDQHWLFVIVLALVAFASLAVIGNRIQYHRCPYEGCHAFFKAVDIGSDVVGKTHVTTHKSRDIYRGKTETSSQIIHNYDREHYTEATTEIEIEDNRQCTECGQTWIVKRTRTEQGHT